MEISHDTLFGGELNCYQHTSGYRFSIDPVLLAHFVHLKKDESILDLGAGCGIISMILLYRQAANIQKITAFELQQGLVALAKKNCHANNFQQQMAVVQGDLRSISNSFAAEHFSTVVCNPPFFVAGSGRKSLNEEALIARHQIECTLGEVIEAAAYVLKNRGRFFCVYPAELLALLFAGMNQNGFGVKRMVPVYSYPEAEGGARLVLLEAVKNGGEGMRVEPPLYIYNRKNGDYSEAVAAMYLENK